MLQLRDWESDDFRAPIEDMRRCGEPTSLADLDAGSLQEGSDFAAWLLKVDAWAEWLRVVPDTSPALDGLQIGRDETEVESAAWRAFRDGTYWWRITENAAQWGELESIHESCVMLYEELEKIDEVSNVDARDWVQRMLDGKLESVPSPRAARTAARLFALDALLRGYRDPARLARATRRLLKLAALLQDWPGVAGSEGLSECLTWISRVVMDRYQSLTPDFAKTEIAPALASLDPRLVLARNVRIETMLWLACTVPESCSGIPRPVEVRSRIERPDQGEHSAWKAQLCARREIARSVLLPYSEGAMRIDAALARTFLLSRVPVSPLLCRAPVVQDFGELYRTTCLAAARLAFLRIRVAELAYDPSARELRKTLPDPYGPGLLREAEFGGLVNIRSVGPDGLDGTQDDLGVLCGSD
jgi:hypothetical protein